MDSTDRLTPVLERFRVTTRLFHTGDLCGLTTFDARPGRGFLHVLREGDLSIGHRTESGRTFTQTVTAPSLVFYPRPLEHSFRTPERGDNDFACAAIEVHGGGSHPLLRALPDVVVLPLDAVGTLSSTLDLLFREIDAVQCGRRLVADRLFEVVLIQLFRWMLDHPDGVALPPGMLAGLADPALAPALIAVHTNPGRAWTVASMATACAHSRSAFAARFARVVGQTPMEYLTEWRVTVAQDDLLAGASVSRAAMDAGYSTPAAFTRAFTQRVGASPRAWLAAARPATPVSARPTSPARAAHEG
ncbi:AraC family transcriptional regulator [Demequina sp. SO4-18]|uniref:AraC family transcriptional regulator n=1 Tax=Demequina sp. SO4-18 TaxID=3401026 RepID=UPI003B58CFA7